RNGQQEGQFASDIVAHADYEALERFHCLLRSASARTGPFCSLSRLAQPIKARSLRRREGHWICVAARRIAPSAGSEALAHLEDEAGCGGCPRNDGARCPVPCGGCGRVWLYPTGCARPKT